MKKLILLMLVLVLMSPLSIAVHDDNTCQGTDIVTGDISFLALFGKNVLTNLESEDKLPASVVEGDLVEGAVYLEFDDNIPAEEVTVEVGMYPVNSPQALGFSFIDAAFDLSATPTRNCVAGEDFVDSFHVQTKAQADNGLFVGKFDLKAPVDSELNDGGERDYILQAVVFKNCYKSCGDENNVYKWTQEKITLKDNPELNSDPANDGVQNNDETDIDCGGDSGNGCEIGYRCDTVDDCVDEADVCGTVEGGTNKICKFENNDDGEGNDKDMLKLFFLGLFGFGAFIVLVGLVLWLKE